MFHSVYHPFGGRVPGEIRVNNNGAVVHGVVLVGGHGHNGHAEVDSEHVDHAEPEEGQESDNKAPLHWLAVPSHLFLRAGFTFWPPHW